MKAKIIASLLALALLSLGVLLWSRYQSAQAVRFSAARPDATTTYTFRVGKDAQLEGVISNLEYYGFVRDQQALLLALEKAKDKTPGDQDSIKIGTNTVDRQSEYMLSQSFDTWKIAQILLNNGKHQDCSHGCNPDLFYPPLLPGGDPAPTLRQQFEWVQTFDDCVRAKGQLSSEEYSKKTQESRRCVSPDGRELSEGKPGWVEARGG